jgi:dolichol-phosphate mannosyltransferase
MSDQIPTLYLIIPLLNETANIPKLIESLGKTSLAFSNRFKQLAVFVDDGSVDETAQSIEKLGQNLDKTIIRHNKNQGPGYAFGSAFEYIGPLLHQGDWICTLEGDNTSNVELLNQMFQRSLEGYDVIFASPYMYGGGFTNTDSLRKFFSFMANTYVREFLGIPGIFTVSSFFRLYKAEVILSLQSIYGDRIITSKGFESMIELTIKLVFMQSTISEVPMVLDSNMRIGKSKMPKLKTILGYLLVGLHRRKWWDQYQNPQLRKLRELS